MRIFESHFIVALFIFVSKMYTSCIHNVSKVYP